jgi:hypothetical protein
MVDERLDPLNDGGFDVLGDSATQSAEGLSDDPHGNLQIERQSNLLHWIATRRPGRRLVTRALV